MCNRNCSVATAKPVFTGRATPGDGSVLCITSILSDRFQSQSWSIFDSPQKSNLLQVMVTLKRVKFPSVTVGDGKQLHHLEWEILSVGPGQQPRKRSLHKVRLKIGYPKIPKFSSSSKICTFGIIWGHMMFTLSFRAGGCLRQVI